MFSKENALGGLEGSRPSKLRWKIMDNSGIVHLKVEVGLHTCPPKVWQNNSKKSCSSYYFFLKYYLTKTMRYNFKKEKIRTRRLQLAANPSPQTHFQIFNSNSQFQSHQTQFLTPKLLPPHSSDRFDDHIKFIFQISK